MEAHGGGRGALGVSWLTRWIRTTFDYNPTFPLSALALMVGLRLLASDGSAEPNVLGVAAGVGTITVYELCLLGVALLVLWPRRIAYETTSILLQSDGFIECLGGIVSMATSTQPQLIRFLMTLYKRRAAFNLSGFDWNNQIAQYQIKES